MNSRKIDVHLEYDALNYKGELVRVDRHSEFDADVNITSEMVMKAMNSGNLDDIAHPFKDDSYWKILDRFSLNYSGNDCGNNRITLETCVLFHMVKFVMIKDSVTVSKWEYAA